MKTIRELLENSNFITRMEIGLNKITKEDVEEFSKEHELTWFYNSRFASLMFEDKEGNVVTDFKSLSSWNT